MGSLDPVLALFWPGLPTATRNTAQRALPNRDVVIGCVWCVVCGVWCVVCGVVCVGVGAVWCVVLCAVWVGGHGS